MSEFTSVSCETEIRTFTSLMMIIIIIKMCVYIYVCVRNLSYSCIEIDLRMLPAAFQGQ